MKHATAFILLVGCVMLVACSRETKQTIADTNPVPSDFAFELVALDIAQHAEDDADAARRFTPGEDAGLYVFEPNRQLTIIPYVIGRPNDPPALSRVRLTYAQRLEIWRLVETLDLLNPMPSEMDVTPEAEEDDAEQPPAEWPDENRQTIAYRMLVQVHLYDTVYRYTVEPGTDDPRLIELMRLLGQMHPIPVAGE